MSEQTFWNYEPTPCRKVRVIVGPCRVPTFWHNGLEGTEREVVEVNYHGNVFYLDNEGGAIGASRWPAGEGWEKVTKGRGGSIASDHPLNDQSPNYVTVTDLKRSRYRHYTDWDAETESGRRSGCGRIEFDPR